MVFGSHAREQRDCPRHHEMASGATSLISPIVRRAGRLGPVYEIPAGVSVVSLRLWRLPLILPP